MTTKTIRPWVALLMVLALAVAACGGGSGAGNGDDGDSDGDTATTAAAAGDAVEVTIRTTEFSFDPERIEVPAGAPVTLVLVNEGVVEHDLSIEAIGLHILAQPGETVRETATFQPGTYEVICTVPGHHDAGMEGTLVAQ